MRHLPKLFLLALLVSILSFAWANSPAMAAGRWKAAVVEYAGEIEGKGRFEAVIYNKREKKSEVVGVYETEAEAEEAGEEAAKKKNRGVMDGPGCDPPLVLC